MIKYIEKPWGYEEIIESNELYCFKKLFIKHKHRLSLQRHEKDETLYIKSGQALLLLANINDEELKFIRNPSNICYRHRLKNCELISLKEGMKFRIHPNQVHSIIADFGDVEIFEVSNKETPTERLIVKTNYEHPTIW